MSVHSSSFILLRMARLAILLCHNSCMSKREGEPYPVEYLVQFVEMRINEYDGLDPRIQRVMSFGEFIHLKQRCKVVAGASHRGGQSNEEVQKVAGKVTPPYFDGSAKSLARVWVQNLDTYPHLNPMQEIDVLRFSTLHLEGDEQQWWYHVLITLRHTFLLH